MPKTDFTVIDGGKLAPKKITKTKPRSQAIEHVEQAVEHLQSALDTRVRGHLRTAIEDALEAAQRATAPKPKTLTDLNYESLKPGRELVDPSRPGFRARCTRKGVRFFLLTTDPETGKQREVEIGYMYDTSLAEAREVWKDLRQQRLQGQMPVKPEDGSGLPTISALVDRYLREYAMKLKRSWKGDARLLNKHVVPEYGHLTADQFTDKEVAVLFASLAHTPRELGKLRACLNTLFNVSVGKTRKLTLAEPWLPRSFTNPVTNVQIAKHESDVSAPTNRQIKSYAKNLYKVGLREDYADLLMLQLLCASRISEIAGMTWGEVDLEAGEWLLPAERSKNGKEHRVLLSRQAIEILERRHEQKAGQDQHVFTAVTDRTRPLRADLVSHALADSREALGVSERFTSHAVRHALSTWAAEEEYSVEVVNRVTAHVVASGINQVYNHARLNKPARGLWQDWADHLLP